jgi:hypothetical protein
VTSAGAAGHPPRPPIPMRPLDEAAMEAARARGAADEDVWLAGVTGDPAAPRRERAVVGDRRFGERVGELEVGELAAAVDRGRDLAAAAAREGVTVLRATEPAGSRDAARRIAAWAAGSDHADIGPAHPLRALRRLGDEPLAVLCGAALGAGEHGLAYVHDGPAGEAAAAVATGIEPALAPRVRRG